MVTVEELPGVGARFASSGESIPAVASDSRDVSGAVGERLTAPPAGTKSASVWGIGVVLGAVTAALMGNVLAAPLPVIGDLAPRAWASTELTLLDVLVELLAREDLVSAMRVLVWLRLALLWRVTSMRELNPRVGGCGR